MIDSSFHISEIDRRLANMIRIGVVKEADYLKARLRIQIGETVTDWLPWMAERAGNIRSWSPPTVGEQVMVLSPHGETTSGLVLPAIYQNQYPAPSTNASEKLLTFKDGTMCSYNSDSCVLDINIKDKGKIMLKVGKSFIEISAEGIKLQGPRIDLN